MKQHRPESAKRFSENDTQIRLGRQLDENAPSVNAPTWGYTGAVNAGRRPIGKFQMEKPAASFPARAQLLR
jgi:hypothetical protein